MCILTIREKHPFEIFDFFKKLIEDFWQKTANLYEKLIKLFRAINNMCSDFTLIKERYF